MKLLYLLLILLALIAFVKMSFYLGFMALGVFIGIFLYNFLQKKFQERQKINKLTQN